MVSGIFVGIDLNIIISSFIMGCSLMDIIIVLDCNCVVVMLLMSNGDVIICQGDLIFIFSVSVNFGEMVDWYDVLVSGILLVMSNINYLFLGAGIYYVEMRVLVDGCVSLMCIVVILMINLMFVLVFVDMVCFIDLFIYMVMIILMDVSFIIVSSGSINDEGGGVFIVSGIFIGIDLMFNVFNVDMSCELGVIVVILL